MTAKPLLTGVLAGFLLFSNPAVADVPAEAATHVHVRGDFSNSRLRFEREKEGHVAFLGGSITENQNGHTAMVPAWLSERFPETAFTFTNAGLSSTCSVTGAFRLQEHVLKKGPVDLFIVEFAVNDDQDAGHSEREALRGMEGIIRHVRDYNPAADIIVVHYVNPGMFEAYRAGEKPVSARAHERVAKHYGVSSVNVGAALAALAEAGKMTWEDYGGTHPKQPGYRLASDMIVSVMKQAWEEPLPASAELRPHTMPEPIDPDSYTNGEFVSGEVAAWMGGWQMVPVGREALPLGSIRKNYESYELLLASEPGATLTLDFRGRAVGAFVLAGPDAGVVETSVDGGPFKKHDLYHHFSKNLNYPRTVMFGTGLAAGYHQLTLRVSEDKNEESQGHRAAILYFTINE